MYKRQAQKIRWAVYLVVGLILLASSVMSPSTVLWCAALAAGLLTVVQVLSDQVKPQVLALDEAAEQAVIEGSFTAE